MSPEKEAMPYAGAGAGLAARARGDGRTPTAAAEHPANALMMGP